MKYAAPQDKPVNEPCIRTPYMLEATCAVLFSQWIAVRRHQAWLSTCACSNTAKCFLQMPLWDELWWHDGLYHSQPVLDGTLEPQLQSPVSSSTQLVMLVMR